MPGNPAFNRHGAPPMRWASARRNNRSRTRRVLAARSSAIHYRTATVDGVEIFYREAGPVDGPVVVLLHGFPTSSHMFRNLMPLLADGYPGRGGEPPTCATCPTPSSTSSTPATSPWKTSWT